VSEFCHPATYSKTGGVVDLSVLQAQRKHVANFLNQILDRSDAVVLQISEDLSQQLKDSS
jgi:hypothetical protein